MDFDPENIKRVITSNHDLGKAIQSARRKKVLNSSAFAVTMTQSELDKACNFPKNTVRAYENGTATVIPEQLNTLNRILCVTLPRPKK